MNFMRPNARHLLWVDLSGLAVLAVLTPRRQFAQETGGKMREMLLWALGKRPVRTVIHLPS